MVFLSDGTGVVAGTLFNNLDSTAFLIKFNDQGDSAWSRSLHWNGNSTIAALCSDGSSGLYVLGTTWALNQNKDLVLAHFDEFGSQTSFFSYDLSNNDAALKIELAGSTLYALIEDSLQNLAVVSISTSGTILWKTNTDLLSKSRNKAMTPYYSDGVIIAGEQANGNMAFRKISASGSMQTLFSYNINWFQARNCQLSNNGEVIVIGTFDNSGSGGVLYLTYNPISDRLSYKIVGNNGDIGRALYVKPDGTLYYCGSSDAEGLLMITNRVFELQKYRLYGSPITVFNSVHAGSSDQITLCGSKSGQFYILQTR